MRGARAPSVSSPFIMETVLFTGNNYEFTVGLAFSLKRQMLEDEKLFCRIESVNADILKISEQLIFPTTSAES